MTRRSRLHKLINGSAEWPVLVDVGTNSLTGFRRGDGNSYDSTPLSHPTLNVAALSPQELSVLGSDFARIGFRFAPAELDQDDTFIDRFGVRQLFTDGVAGPLEHPLEDATSASEFVSHPRPIWDDPIEVLEDGDLIAIADIPCPGLLDQALAMRGSWKLMDDLTENWRNTSALFDWALENIVACYEALLEASPVKPDVIIYADDIGFKDSMFLSEVDFRRFMKPRLATLFSRLRKLCDAPILFHSCGAIRPVLGDIADLGIDILNIDTYARGMNIADVRRQVPEKLPLHGITPLDVLGAALRKNDAESALNYISYFMKAWPAVLAPVDSMPATTEATDVVAAVRCIRSLDPESMKRDDSAALIRSIMKTSRLAEDDMIVGRDGGMFSHEMKEILA